MSDVTSAEEQAIPRFVLSISDTKTIIQGGEQGEQYLSVSIGANHLQDFTKAIPFKKRIDGNPGKTEMEAMLFFFQEQVDKADIERGDDDIAEFTQAKIK